MSKGTAHRTVRIEDELWEAAKAKAKAEDRNLSDVIREGLRAYVKPGNITADAWDEAWDKAVFWDKNLRDVDEPNPYRPAT